MLDGCELLFSVGAPIDSLIILSTYCMSGAEPGSGPYQGTALPLHSCGVVRWFVTLGQSRTHLGNLMKAVDSFSKKKKKPHMWKHTYVIDLQDLQILMNLGLKNS